jgi:hypothetical protein
MKQFLHSIDYLLWVLVIVAELALWAGAIRRQLASDFPRFVLLLGFVCSRSLMLVFINFLFSLGPYFYAYYWSTAIESLLLILVTAEIFKLVFEPVSALPPSAISRMAGAIVVIAAVAVTVATWPPSKNFDLTFSVVYRVRTAVDIVICFSCWLLAIYSRLLGLRWRSRLADIMSGFLFYLTIQSFTHMLLWIIPDKTAVLSRIESAAYLGGLCFWFAALRQQEPVFTTEEQGRPLLLRAHIANVYSEADRLEALEIQAALSRALLPPGGQPRPRTIEDLLPVLRPVEFPEYEPISYGQMLALRRDILHNCEWLQRFVRDQYRPLVEQLDLLAEVETLQEDILRITFECHKVFLGYSEAERLRRMRRLAKLYNEVQLAAMLLCGGVQPYLTGDLELAL